MIKKKNPKKTKMKESFKIGCIIKMREKMTVANVPMSHRSKVPKALMGLVPKHNIQN